jgi:hypothetical protein
LKTLTTERNSTMAIFTPGGIVGQISGRVAGSIFSHNRGGTYIRNGTIPHIVISDPATDAKARMTTVSREWSGQSEANRLAWQNYAQQNPVTNRLGKKTTLAAHMAYCGINTRLSACGLSKLNIPPNGDAPAPLSALSGVCSLGAGTCELTFATSPVPAGELIYLEAVVVDKPSINYINNLFKLIGTLPSGTTSTEDIQALIEARFGILQLNDVIHVRANVMGDSTGLMSGPMNAIITVVA